MYCVPLIRVLVGPCTMLGAVSAVASERKVRRTATCIHAYHAFSPSSTDSRLRAVRRVW